LIDLLGFGESPMPWKNYTQDLHLEALNNVLKKYDSYILVGHSLGAILSLAYIQKYKTNVKALILISLPVFNKKNDAYNWMRRKPSGWLITNMIIAAIKCLLTRYIARKLIIRFLKNYPKEVLEDLVKHNFLSSTTSLWNVIYNQSTYNNLDLIDPSVFIKCIHSLDDDTAPFNAVANLVQKHDFIKLKVLHRSGHHPWLRDNTKCIDVINEVIKITEEERVII
jgi:pimeloyl-ACP methyl ester carboxylesterase